MHVIPPSYRTLPRSLAHHPAEVYREPLLDVLRARPNRLIGGTINPDLAHYRGAVVVIPPTGEDRKAAGGPYCGTLHHAETLVRIDRGADCGSAAGRRPPVRVARLPNRAATLIWILLRSWCYLFEAVFAR